MQHYFPSKDDMLLHAFTHARGRTEQRVLADAQLLPLDDRRRRDYRVELAFTGRVVDNPRLAQALGESNAHLRGTLAQAIHNGKECGEVAGDTDEGVEAARLLATLDGLKLHAYTEPGTMTPAAARAALADQLQRVFTGPCHHRTQRPGAGLPTEVG